MPATSERQRRFMAAELARKRAGKKTHTGMTEGQLSDYARKPKSYLPPGADQSPKGDLQKLSDYELTKAFPRPIKGAGGNVVPSKLLKMRHEKMVSDNTDGHITSLECREVPAVDKVV